MLIVVVLPAQGLVAPLPSAPERFSWVAIDDIDAFFLRPDGWHFTHSQAKLRGSFVISREPSDIDFRFETGLSGYVVNNLGKMNGRLVSEQIDEYIHNLGSQDSLDILTTTPITRMAYRGIGVRFHDRSNEKSIINHRLYLANDRTDTLFIINFESPEAIWSTTWPIGETLVTHFILDASETTSTPLNVGGMLVYDKRTCDKEPCGYTF